MHKSLQKCLSKPGLFFLAKSLGLDLGGTLFGIIKIGVKGEMSYEAKSVYENLSTTRREIRREIKKTDTYEVGPNSRLTLYRLVFTGPGINYVSSTLSSTPHKLEDVVISYNLEQKYFLKDIDVVYTRDSVSRPNNIITEVSGQNPDINAGFGGAYVWLVAQWTTKLEERATGIEIAIQRRANNNYKDLAKGAGGQFRYIIIQRDTHRSEVITNIALYRRRNSRDTPTSSGWMHMTGDINRRRRGDYLYLCWNTESF